MKKTWILGLIFVTMLCMTGCGTSQLPTWKLKKQGKAKVISHIEDKYGKTPKIVKAEVEWGSGATPAGCLPKLSDIGPDGSMIYTLDIDGHEFTALTEADRDDGIVYDDYEKEYILSQLTKDLAERLDITTIGSYIKFIDTQSYGVGKDQYGKLRKLYQDPVSFFNQCHTKFFVGTTDELDEEKLKELWEAYSIKTDLAYLHLNLVQFQEDMMYVYDEEQYQYEKYVIADPDVVDYYVIEKSASHQMNRLKHKDEIILEEKE